jgi:hypothetical protein
MWNDDALVTIAVFDTVFDASLARGALESAGIPALVPEETLVRSRTHFEFAASLQVFESDRVRAAIELRRMQIRIVSGSSTAEVD